MAKDDWGIVVGVTAYPEIGDLEGPENDARAFYDWLFSPTGGAIEDRNHVELIVTSQWKPARSPALTKPTELRVRKACLDLFDVAERNSSKGKGRRVGRRLYLFMSGHGFEPTDNEPALIMADSDARMRLGSGFHVLGPYTADLFYKSGLFDEVVLLMDCCREVPDTRVPLNKPLDPPVAQDGLESRKRFYAFATKWSRLSRERPMEGGKVHGVFTQALLTGLQNAAAEGGQVTTDSLRNYLLNRNIWSSFLSAEDLNDPEVPKEPQALILDRSFVLVNLPAPAGGPPGFPVSVHLPPNAAGKKVQIQDARFSVVDTALAQPPLWQVCLQPGLYQAQILELGLQKDFEVKGVGGSTDVQF